MVLSTRLPIAISGALDWMDHSTCDVATMKMEEVAVPNQRQPSTSPHQLGASVKFSLK
jgi:hypothetical protein